MLPNGNPNATPESYYNASVTNTVVEVSDHKCNIYGFEVENNGAADVFIQIFDKLAVNVTLGTTAPDITFRIPANSNFGKDSQGYALRYMKTGMSIAITSGRSSAAAPASPATVNLWFSQGA